MIDNISASFLLNCSGLNIFPGVLKYQNSCGLHHAPHFQLSNGSSKSKICSSSAELLQFLTQPTYDPADNHHSSTNPPGHRECATATPARGHTQGNETLPSCFGHDTQASLFLKRTKPLTTVSMAQNGERSAPQEHTQALVLIGLVSLAVCLDVQLLSCVLVCGIGLSVRCL